MDLNTAAILENDTIIYQRLIGSYTEGKPGPVFVGVSCLHGNEHSGNIALNQVLDKLQLLNIPIKGSFHAVTGNLPALKANLRFLDEDMNRAWSKDNFKLIQEAAGNHDVLPAELREISELCELFKKFMGNLGQSLYFVDLHTTSSISDPFFILGDTIRNRRFAEGLPVPVVLGVEEQIEGTMSTYLSNTGHIAINFEAGQHDDPVSIKRHEAAIWMLLVRCGCIRQEDVPQFEERYRDLTDVAKHLPHVFESRLRYSIEEGEGFTMNSGYRNFGKIHKNQFLAESDGKKIYAGKKGRIFMPLYQRQGDDGFFIINRINPIWLKISVWVRKMNLDRLLKFLPGIKRHPDQEGTYIVNQNIARFLSKDLFHLMGYRKIKRSGKLLYMTRRKFDFKGPGE